jgi:hypothetical protein
MTPFFAEPRTRLERWRLEGAFRFAWQVARPALEVVIGPHARIAELIAVSINAEARACAVFQVEDMTFTVGFGASLEVRLRHADGSYGTPILSSSRLSVAMVAAGFEPFDS